MDDEPLVLEAIARLLRRDYDVTTANGGADGIVRLKSEGPFAVIVSDLRMPGMDGIEVLHRAREVAPDTVRLLLTGFADLDSAIHVVNEAQIFRFLTKPCSRDQLVSALEPAVEQHRLVTAERVLLEETLQGCIRALIDALALANPMAFGRASRVKHRASELAALLNLTDRWQIEMAAMLSQVGMISLSAVTVEKLFSGKPLDRSESEALAGLPALADQLLAHVPRLEGVREIVRLQNEPFDGPQARDGHGRRAPIGSRVLRAVLDFDLLESQGHEAAQALEMMRSEARRYDPAILDALCSMHNVEKVELEIRVVPLDSVQPGMRLMEDVKTRNGLLLIPKGFEMNAALRERMRSYDPAVLHAPVRVTVSARPTYAN